MWGVFKALCVFFSLDLIKFFLLVTIVIIPDVLLTNLITKPYQSCLVVITGTQNSHVVSFQYYHHGLA